LETLEFVIEGGHPLIPVARPPGLEGDYGEQVIGEDNETETEADNGVEEMGVEMEAVVGKRETEKENENDEDDEKECGNEKEEYMGENKEIWMKGCYQYHDGADLKAEI